LSAILGKFAGFWLDSQDRLLHEPKPFQRASKPKDCEILVFFARIGND
jgi:hypothetical protein